MRHRKKYTQIIEKPQGDVIILYPGSFKMLHGGHLDLIKKYSEHPDVKEVRVLIGPGVRNGIDQDLAFHIAVGLTNNIENVNIFKSKWPSPILASYKEIEEATPGKYALAASTKGDDYKRVNNFTEQHQPGGKYSSKVPVGVEVVELLIEVEPKEFSYLRDDEFMNQPISASVLRNDIINGDYDIFQSGFPDTDNDTIKNIWDILQENVVKDPPKIKKLKKEPLKKEVIPKVNKHMNHVEDLVILDGLEGLEWVTNMLYELYNELNCNASKGDIKLSVKIDGAPAIFAWSNFRDLPKNGIAMKGLFSKTPKTFNNNKELFDNFNDRPDLEYKLKTFLKYLPEIGIPKGEIWQGDFLFDNTSLNETIIDNEEYYSFHPNTIYYAIKKDSDLGKIIKKAEVGITWHTRYTGTRLDNIQANYNTKTSELNIIDKILMTDPYIKSFDGIGNFSKEETTKVEDILTEISEIKNQISKSFGYKEILKNKDVIALFSIFQNSLIKSNIKIDDPSIYIEEFIEFIKNRAVKAADKLKSEKGKIKSFDKFTKIIENVQYHETTWYIIIHTIKQITFIKELFIKRLNNTGSFQTFLKMKEGGLRPTNQEGFALADLNGNIVKLIDRREFSWSNFSLDVKKGWE